LFRIDVCTGGQTTRPASLGRVDPKIKTKMLAAEQTTAVDTSVLFDIRTMSG